MENAKNQQTNSKPDKYVSGMDWGKAELKDFELSNYRKYQYDLISKFIGSEILEIGSGDRSFTKQIIKNKKKIDKIVSIEPSTTLTEIYSDKYSFPESVKFIEIDLFDMTADKYGLFDTIILIHVLEHVEFDREALNHLYSLLKPGGMILIEVPALRSLFSIHDKILGHYRRYNKKNFKLMVNTDFFQIKKLWYQDAIGMLGSFFYFKLKKINLQSSDGVSLVKNQGILYDKFIIPFERFYEKFLKLPFGLSLTGVLQKK